MLTGSTYLRSPLSGSPWCVHEPCKGTQDWAPLRLGPTINVCPMCSPRRNVAKEQGSGWGVPSQRAREGSLAVPGSNACLLGLRGLPTSRRAMEDPDGSACQPWWDFSRRTDCAHAQMAVVQSSELSSKAPEGEDVFLRE